MASSQRAFSQKISKLHAADLRKTVSAVTEGKHPPRSASASTVSSISQSQEVFEPIDYEEFIEQHQLQVDRDPAKSILQFPPDDIKVITVPRLQQTIEPVVPDGNDVPDAHVGDCVRCYTKEWVYVSRQYILYSSSTYYKNNMAADRWQHVQSCPMPEYEVDMDEERVMDEMEKEIASSRHSTVSDTPRGSWSSSNFDLRNSVGDPLLPSLLSRMPQEMNDMNNQRLRQENRQDSIFLLYPFQDEEDMIEKRIYPELPQLHMCHKIMVKCMSLKLEMDIEPIFASMALYDIKEKKKISENFYFDMNSESIKKMLNNYVSYQDISSLSRTGIFNITYPSNDLYLVVRLEKVLQGDVSDALNAYMKDDSQNKEKLKMAAVSYCERLGKYKMPLAWTAINLADIIFGQKETAEKECNATQGNLDRKQSTSSFDEMKRKATSASLTRRGSLDRRSFNEKRRSWCQEEFNSCLDSFRPVTLTVSTFFKQEGDKLRDEDLYKYLPELKRPSSQLKKKCFPGLLKLDISPLREIPKYCLTPELSRLRPYPDEKCRPVKEIAEFSTHPILEPNNFYRNLLFVSPKDLNFSNRPGSARNIAVKVQFMSGEDSQNAEPVIFGRSSCPEFSSEALTVVTYHNKSPDFYDEYKIKLPASLGDHHLLFTFYHVSCQKKTEEKTLETPVGYTWLPIYRDGSLQTGEHSLPVMMEQPPPNYSYITADIQLPGTKWVDNHKGIFNVVVNAASTVHSQDKYLDNFFLLCKMIEDKRIPARIGELKIEAELKKSMGELVNAEDEPLVQFIPVLFDKLMSLMVQPPHLAGQLANLAQATFNACSALVAKISRILEDKNDQHGRNSTLLNYIGYQVTLPHFRGAATSPEQSYNRTKFDSQSNLLNISPQHRRSTSNPDIGGEADSEVGLIMSRGLDRTNSMRIGGEYANVPMLMQGSPGKKLVHEEIAFQWVVSSGLPRESALVNSWFFFELMLKSMCEHLAKTGNHEAPRKLRFTHHFCDDIENLSSSVTNDIIAYVCKDIRNVKITQNINSCLAFFLSDLLSVMDRGFVFGLIRSYCKQMTSRVSSLRDPTSLINLKLDFVRIICSHEHFIALNLPFCTPLSGVSAPSSPCPSAGSSNSRGSFVSTVVGGDKSLFMTLSSAFCQQHFLVGIVLSDLNSSLKMNNPCIHGRAVNAVRNLLTSHDTDDRYKDPDVRARVAALFLPLVGIVVESLPQLYTFTSHASAHVSNPYKDEGDSESAPYIHQNVAMAISQSSVYGARDGDNDVLPGQNPKCPLSSDTTRNLLICFLWVLKNIDDVTLRKTCSELSQISLHQLLDILYITASCFEYKGAKHVFRDITCTRTQGAKFQRSSSIGADCKPPIPPQFHAPHFSSLQGKKSFSRGTSGTLRNKADMRSRLEEAIMGQNSARSEMIQRRRAERSPSTGPIGGNSCSTGEKLRWRKESFPWKNQQSMYTSTHQEVGEKTAEDMEEELQIEAHLGAEANMTILETLEIIVQVLTHADHLQLLLTVVFKVLLHILTGNQSTTALINMFNTQRSLVSKFPGLLFDEETEQCADLCLQLLKRCSSCICTVRSHASASLYLLMRHNFEIGNNFARVKMQVTMSLSSLVGTSHTFNEAFLKRSLKTILTYAEEDSELQETSFPEQVKDLIFNLHMILSDTVKMKEYQEDPEMLLDLMYRIARGYQNSPDLRLTWLANMAQKHSERSQHAEAAMCFIHSAALVSEYLYMLEDKPYLPIGAVTYTKLSPNALEESAVSDDVLSPDEEGICTGKYFSEAGLIALLEQASSSFLQSGMFECINEVYKIMMPIAEHQRDWKKLVNIHSKLHDAFSKIEQLEGKRIFGAYFRVGFYGSKFGDLDGEEYIYKEPTLTKLPEISHRLESFFSDRFGAENFEIIKDSNVVDPGKLKPEKAYIQITYVEPYFDVWEESERVTTFEKNYNLKRFIFSTPFTPDGRAHGDLHEQHKRKTILTTQNMFPYIKTRVQVVDRYSWVLSPIEVAIEDIQKKTQELTLAIKQDPPDQKILPMVLQGCLGTTVNQGPMEIAHVFLSELVQTKSAPNRHQNKLRLCFKDFTRRCYEALKRNKSLIGPEMRDYQRELERNYHQFTEKLSPMVAVSSISRPQSQPWSNGAQGSKMEHFNRN